MKKLFLTAAILIFSFAAIHFAEAGGASLYLSPATGTFYIGSTFDVSIFLNTGGNDVNAVRVDLKFDPKKFQIASPTAGKSFISVWVAQPSFSNAEGSAFFQGGMPSPGINTSSGLVSTITFRAIAPGEATVTFLDSSQVLLDDGKGTDILTYKGKSIYAISIPPPEGPKVFSSTHPDQNKWYNNSSPTFSWEKEAGVNGFSYAFDQNFYSIPDDMLEGDHASASFASLEDGIWYFHIRGKKGNVWGGASHYVVMIDTTPPAAFQVSFEPKIRSDSVTSQEPILYFVTTDNLSGIDHYTLKLIDLASSLPKEIAGFFVEASSPYKMPSLAPGQYRVVVRAFDAAMNYQDASEKFEAVPLRAKLLVSGRGIFLLTLFFSWGRLILIFTFLILGIGVAIFAANIRRKKIHELIYREKMILSGLREKIKGKEQEIKKKIFPDSKNRT